MTEIITGIGRAALALAGTVVVLGLVMVLVLQAKWILRAVGELIAAESERLDRQQRAAARPEQPGKVQRLGSVKRW
jgi:hypothetical protein